MSGEAVNFSFSNIVARTIVSESYNTGKKKSSSLFECDIECLSIFIVFCIGLHGFFASIFASSVLDILDL